MDALDDPRQDARGQRMNTWMRPALVSWLPLCALTLLVAPATAQEPGAPRALRARTASAAPAQAEAVELFGSEVPAQPPAAPGGEPTADHPAWAAYHQAFLALSAGRRTECLEQLRHLEQTYASHPLASRASALIRQLTDSGRAADDERAVVATPAAPGEGRDGPATSLSRAEFVVAQTIHGVGLGLELCLLAECDDSRAVGASMIAGGGVGLGLSLLLTGDGITPGHAAMLNAGTAWGAASGFFLSGAINPTSDEARVIPASMIAGQLAGMGLGHLIWRGTHASAGDVAIATSGGLWLDFVTLMVTLAADIDTEPTFGALLASTVVGLGAGALIADQYPMSRGRVLVIDGGAAVGALVGVGAGLIIQSDEEAPYFLLPAIGAVGGLALTTYLTRNWDRSDNDLPQVAFGLSPWQGGGMFSGSLTW